MLLSQMDFIQKNYSEHVQKIYKNVTSPGNLNLVKKEKFLKRSKLKLPELCPLDKITVNTRICSSCGFFNVCYMCTCLRHA